MADFPSTEGALGALSQGDNSANAFPDHVVGGVTGVFTGDIAWVDIAPPGGTQVDTYTAYAGLYDGLTPSPVVGMSFSMGGPFVGGDEGLSIVGFGAEVRLYLKALNPCDHPVLLLPPAEFISQVGSVLTGFSGSPGEGITGRIGNVVPVITGFGMASGGAVGQMLEYIPDSVSGLPGGNSGAVGLAFGICPLAAITGSVACLTGSLPGINPAVSSYGGHAGLIGAAGGVLPQVAGFDSGAAQDGHADPTWTQLSGLSSITYRVQTKASTNEPSDWTGATETTVTDAGTVAVNSLTNSTKYWQRVRAEKSGYTSGAWSTADNVTPASSSVEVSLPRYFRSDEVLGTSQSSSTDTIVASISTGAASNAYFTTRIEVFKGTTGSWGSVLTALDVERQHLATGAHDTWTDSLDFDFSFPGATLTANQKFMVRVTVLAQSTSASKDFETEALSAGTYAADTWHIKLPSQKCEIFQVDEEGEWVPTENRFTMTYGDSSNNARIEAS